MLNKFMRSVLFLFLLILPCSIYCQNISPEVISSAGGTLSNAQYLVDWTLGEPVIETVSGTTNILTQGFHQPHYFLTSLQEVPEYTIEVYPNPASSVIIINTTIQQPLKATLFDLNGKMLEEIHFTKNAELNISNLARSVYLLNITDQNKYTVKIIRIVKTH